MQRLSRKVSPARQQLLLEARAREMRTQPGSAESRLWAELRSRKLGVAFRRQVVLAERIVDFLAPSSRLVIEVDGGYHRERLRADARRDAALARLGFRVLHIEAELVMQDLLGLNPICCRPARLVRSD